MPKAPSKKPVAKKPKADKGLNAQERLFVDEYLKDLDPQRAALAAGYSLTVSKSKAYSWVSRGKEKPHVYAAVLAAMEKRSRKTGVTQERVLEELGRLAFSDVRKYYDEEGRLKLPHELDDDAAAAVASMETVEEFGAPGTSQEQQGHGGALNRRAVVGYAKKFKLHSKPEALRMAMQHLGMLRDKVDLNVNGNILYEVDFGTPQG